VGTLERQLSIVIACEYLLGEAQLKLRFNFVAFFIFACIFIMPQINACEWAEGYFYQVTSLRGRVVDRDHTLLESIRWWKQTFPTAHAMLSLYEYRRPISSLNDMPLVRTLETDSEGEFDFGSLRTGHYTLTVEDRQRGMFDMFDVEVKDSPRVTESVTIDVTHTTLDCKGGHYFIVKNK